MGSQIRCVVLMGLWLIGSGAAAQEVDLAPLPLCGPTEYFELQASIAPAVQSQDVGGPVISKEKPPRPERQQGTSNDRVLRTMPNFLRVGSADEIPPLSLGQKFRVTARDLFDLFEFVLTGSVGGLGQASTATQRTDKASKDVGSAMVRPMPPSLHQDPRYYQLGSGGSFRRSWHAVGRVLITRSDSGKAQPNISELGGAAAAAAISGERAKSWQCGECVDHTDCMGFAYVYD